MTVLTNRMDSAARPLRWILLASALTLSGTAASDNESTNTTPSSPPATLLAPGISQADALNLVKLCISLGMLPDADALLDEISRQSGANVELDRGWLQLSIAETAQGNYDKAEQALNKIQSANDQIDQAKLQQRATLYRLRDNPVGATETLKQLLKQRPDDAFARYNLGVNLSRSGRTAEAITQLTVVAQQDGNERYRRHLRDQTQIRLAELLLKEGETDAAIIALQRVSPQSNFSAQALSLIGQAQIRKTQWHAALASWETLISDYPTEAGHYWLSYAALIEQLGNKPQALAIYRKAATQFTQQQAQLEQIPTSAEPEIALSSIAATSPTVLDTLFQSDKFPRAWREYKQGQTLNERLIQTTESLKTLQKDARKTKNSAIVNKLQLRISVLRQQLRHQSQPPGREAVNTLLHEHLRQYLLQIRQYHDRAGFEVARLLDEAAQRRPESTP